MGGTVAWTIRLGDGALYKMNRWTNVVGDFHLSPKFLQGDPEAFHEAVEAWLGMKDDWERNKDTGEYENNMTGRYAPYPASIRPVDYGIIVTDFQTKTVGSCQGYTSIGNYTIQDWILDDYPEDNTTLNEDDIAYKLRIEEMRLLHSLGCFTSYITFDRDNPPIDITKMTFEDAVATVLCGKQLGFLKLTLPYGWKVIECGEDSAGRRKAYDAIIALNLGLTQAEDAAFQDWINETGEWSDV
jgi:hypothetical protein